MKEETKKQMLDEIREKCGEKGVELAQDIIGLGEEELGMGLLILGFMQQFDATKEELHTIIRVLSYFKDKNDFAYKQLEITLIKMFHRNLEKRMGEFMDEKTTERVNNGASN